MNVLVTGGAGYIGSHAAKSLARAGYNPICYDNLSRGHDWAVRWGPLVKADLSEVSLLKSTLKKYEIQAIMHFAAYAYVGESMAQPGKYFENNSTNSLRLLQAAHEMDVEYFIFSSTCATYGSPESLPIREDHPQRPENPYGESKLIVEKLLRWYGTAHSLKWVALRYFNAAGADPDGELGECHEPETHLIPLVFEAALDSKRPIHVFGTDYSTRDGTAIRDYIHVSDLAAAHVSALGYLTNGGQNRAFNLGTGIGHSVNEIVEGIASVTGLKPAVATSARRPGDPAILIADPSSAESELGWRAQHVALAEILHSAWEWRKSGHAARAVVV